MFKETPLLSSIGVTELMARAKLIGAETFRYLEPITNGGSILPGHESRCRRANYQA
jgi:polar amino acid transport system permease protein